MLILNEKINNIFHIILNRPEKYNAINLAMLDTISQHIDTANLDTGVEFIIIRSSSSNFSAGGDVVALHSYAVKEKNLDICSQILHKEYLLLQKITKNPKPVITIAGGLTFGVGFGLFQSGHLRIAAADTKFAMPENLIGLYPDALTGYFFQKIPYEVARFLSITAGTIPTFDANLADVIVDALPIQLSFSSIDGLVLSLSKVSPVPLPRFLTEKTSDLTTENYISLLKSQDLDQKTLQNLDYASPLSQLVSDKHLSLCSKMSITDVVDFETSLSTRCLIDGDFLEGVRSLLVDKDKTPKWRYTSLKEASHHLKDIL